MTGRERVLTSMDHKEPDRVPIDLGGWQSGISFRTYELVKEILGIESPIRIEDICQGLGQVDEEFLEKYDIDTRYIFPQAPPLGNPFELTKDEFVDEWGITWTRPESSVYYDMRNFPLRDIESSEALDNHNWPDPKNILSKQELIASWEVHQGKEKAIFTSLAGCFEQATYIRGMENFYMDAYINPKYFSGIMDRVLEIQLERYALYFDAVGEYLDLVEFWGDLGTQLAPLISPDLYRSVIKPREKQLVDLVKSKTNAKVALHTCGASSAFIPDIIDVGYDVLNPIQITAAGMQPDTLKKEFGEVITFWGAIDTQQVLPFGSVQEVKDEVKRIIDILAPGGGFILAPAHNIQAYTPPENVIALFETAMEYGKY